MSETDKLRDCIADATAARVGLRLRALAQEKREAEYRAWRSRALRAAMFPGVMIPFRPNRKAWWWKLEFEAHCATAREIRAADAIERADLNPRRASR